MGTGIQGEPNDYDAGLDFDYTVWTAGTRLTLVNVNWDNNYRDTVFFGGTDNTTSVADRKRALNDYIDNRATAGIDIRNATYAKPGQDIFLQVPYNRISRFNYIRASNPLMPIPNDLQKDYYYFIIECEYINPSTTRIRVQLDVWQTYVYDVRFAACYVERGHIGIANENQFDNYGRDYLTVPEGLDIGSEYRTVFKRHDEVIGRVGLSSEIDVLVFSTTDLLSDPGTETNPNLKTGPGSTINGMPSGATAYVFPDTQKFSSWLGTMKDYPWVTQGIVSVNAIPKLGRYLLNDFTYNSVGPTRIINIWLYPKKHKFFTNWRENEGVINKLPSKYRHLKKFFTAPYMVIEMTTWSGTPVVIRPEAWNNPDAFVLERPNIIPPKQRVQFSPRSYNADGQEIEGYLGLTYDDLLEVPGMTPAVADDLWEIWSEAGDDSGEYLDIMTQIADFPQLPIVNNMSISYLAANAHSIDYQRRSAEWTQQRAMSMANRDYSNVTNAIQTAQSLTDIANVANLGQTAISNKNALEQSNLNGLGQIVQGGAGGGVFGGRGAAAGVAAGTGSAIFGGLSAAAQVANNDLSAALSNSSRTADTAIQNRQASLVRDTNKGMADYAARGDYANEIAGINARVQDAAMIQPSISGQFGGDTVNLAHGTMEISIRWKMIDLAAIKVIGDIWLRYGYAIREFLTPPRSLMVMEKFTYWKMNETYLSSGNIPEGYKQAIRGVLEKGVTVWNDPDEIGDFGGTNDPIPGVVY